MTAAAPLLFRDTRPRAHRDSCVTCGGALTGDAQTLADLAADMRATLQRLEGRLDGMQHALDILQDRGERRAPYGAIKAGIVAALDAAGPAGLSRPAIHAALLAADIPCKRDHIGTYLSQMKTAGALAHDAATHRWRIPGPQRAARP